MEDAQLIALYFARNEAAIKETASNYGNKLDQLSFGILKNREDAKECVNDTYLKVWETIPPEEPTYFYAFIAKICRYLCFGRLDYKNAQKRNGVLVSLSDELMACVPDKLAGSQLEEQEIGDLLNKFLKSLSDEKRLIFMRRYWFCESIAEIAKRYRITESKVKTSLYRTRNKLKEFLEQEEITV